MKQHLEFVNDRNIVNASKKTSVSLSPPLLLPLLLLLPLHPRYILHYSATFLCVSIFCRLPFFFFVEMWMEDYFDLKIRFLLRKTVNIQVIFAHNHWRELMLKKRQRKRFAIIYAATVSVILCGILYFILFFFLEFLLFEWWNCQWLLEWWNWRLKCHVFDVDADLVFILLFRFLKWFLHYIGPYIIVSKSVYESSMNTFF